MVFSLRFGVCGGGGVGGGRGGGRARWCECSSAIPASILSLGSHRTVGRT